MGNVHIMRLLIYLLERFPDRVSVQKTESILSVKIGTLLMADIGRVVDFEAVNGRLFIRYNPPLHKEVDMKEWH